MRQRDEGRHLAPGAGAPADPDPDDEPGRNDGDRAEAPGPRGAPVADRRSLSQGDVLRAVADFVDDLVEDRDEVPPDRD
ncbi:MAG TPA: hypothetical protein VK306_16150 [Acidimicrobiales bacterium]|nr:hypothetical protein [Acidimicrobiales bacterium]